MAAKKKSDSPNQNKKTRNTGAKASSAKKSTPKPKNEDKPKDPQVSDDDFGLDDIELEPINEGSAEENMPATISDPVDEIESSKLKPQKEEDEKPLDFSSSSQIESNKADKAKEKPMKKEEKKENNNGTIILIVILLLVIIAAALYFFVFKKEEPKPEPPKIEQRQPVVQPEPEPEPQPEPEPELPKAELFTISAPEGRFYVVIGSFYDVDLAEDQAKAVVESGTSAYMLSPNGDFKFHRVGIAQSSSADEAESKRSELLSTYGENIWVVKY